MGTIVRRLAPVSVVSAAPPSLLLSYARGQPGSIFTLSGWNLTPSALGTLSINGHVISTTLAINETGTFIVFLDCAAADTGDYVVTVSAGASAQTTFVLALDAPLRPQEGGGTMLVVPSGIAGQIQSVYLPLLRR